MNARILLAACASAGALIVLGQLTAVARPGAGQTLADRKRGPVPAVGIALGRGPIGPDVIVAGIPDTRLWAVGEEETAYSFATTSCNIGDENLSWVGGRGVHPVIAQNMFRLREGRMEQIGQAWVKHGFCALQQSGGCGDCPGENGCLQYLAPGCADPYNASRNGGPFGLGPKWEVNAHAGTYEYPPDEGEGTDGDFRRRIRVRNVDLANPGALYFLEGQYVHQEDSEAGNQNNNASNRRVNVNPDTFRLSFVGSVSRQESIMRAWQQNTQDVTLTDVQVPGDGLFVLGHRARVINEGAAWAYEYALYNMNSHRSAQAFSVPVPDDVTITDVGFHDVDYHSGEIWDGTDWTWTIENGRLTWRTDTFDTNERANAHRWGTVYNFRYVADAGPQEQTAVITLFRPGSPGAMCVTTVSPGASGGPCPADIDGNGVVDFTDVLALLASWGQCCGCPADVDGDGDVDFADLLELLAAWGACP